VIRQTVTAAILAGGLLVGAALTAQAAAIPPADLAPAAGAAHRAADAP
jgi:hypothetical protein